MQVDPIKPELKPPGTERLKLNYDVLLLTSAFKINLRRYIQDLFQKTGVPYPLGQAVQVD